MDLTKINELLNGLDDKSRSSITQLIDEKISDDMEKVLMKMHNEFSLLNSKFDHIEEKIATVYWVIGIAGTVLTVVIGLLALKN